MTIKTNMLIAAVALALVAQAAQANEDLTKLNDEPTKLTYEQMDSVTAGASPMSSGNLANISRQSRNDMTPDQIRDLVDDLCGGDVDWGPSPWQ